MSSKSAYQSAIQQKLKYTNHILQQLQELMFGQDFVSDMTKLFLLLSIVYLDTEVDVEVEVDMLTISTRAPSCGSVILSVDSTISSLLPS